MKVPGHTDQPGYPRGCPKAIPHHSPFIIAEIPVLYRASRGFCRILQKIHKILTVPSLKSRPIRPYPAHQKIGPQGPMAPGIPRDGPG